jgi:hypothetical protein
VAHAVPVHARASITLPSDVRAGSRSEFREFIDSTGIVEPAMRRSATGAPSQRLVTSDLGIYAAAGKKL